MDKEYINKVVEDIFVEGMSKLEIKTEVYKRLDKELKGTDRVFLKILKNDIKELEPFDEYSENLVAQIKEFDIQNEGNDQRT